MRVILQLDAGPDGNNATASKFHNLLGRGSGRDSSTTTGQSWAQTTQTLDKENCANSPWKVQEG